MAGQPQHQLVQEQDDGVVAQALAWRLMMLRPSSSDTNDSPLPARVR
jgi:hypothetical protein